MSSGFEATGIVLAALPLLISAVESYRDGLSKISGWRRTDAELKKIQIEFQYQEHLLRNTVSTLLHEAGLSDTAYLSISENDTNAADTQQFDGRLREYLGQDYDLFVNAVEHIGTSLATVLESLQSTTDSLAPNKLEHVSESRLLAKIKWSYARRNKTEKLLDVASTQNRRLGDVLRNIVISKGRISTIEGIDQTFSEVVVSEDLENDDNTSIDTMSISVRYCNRVPKIS